MTSQVASPVLSSYPLVANLYGMIESMRGRTGRQFTKASLSTLNNLQKLDILLETFVPHRTLEIGMALGGSSTLFSEWHKRKNHSPKCHVAIDPFQHSVWDFFASDYLKAQELDAYVEVMNDFSCFALPDLLRADQRFGLIYVDGSHLFEDVFIDFFYSVRLLEKGGVIAFDDSTDAHVAKVHDFIASNMKGKLRRVDVSNATGSPKSGPPLKNRLKGFLGLSQMITYVVDEEFTPREWDSAFRDF